MKIHNVENKAFLWTFVMRLFAHNILKDSQHFLPKGNYDERHGKFPRYFSGWYLFVNSKGLAEGEIIHKKLNGIDLVVHRNKEGVPVIHSDRCSHMDGMFSGGLGTVVDGSIVCGYHKYKFENGVPQSGPKDFKNDV
ncbi:MAG: Rieske (2Fe-2S) protein, partial [Pseudomonadales bacterium]|nr:Rieske (2Fe-2S) protein [Pseudomonadales bacterium]